MEMGNTGVVYIVSTNYGIQIFLHLTVMVSNSELIFLDLKRTLKITVVFINLSIISPKKKFSTCLSRRCTKQIFLMNKKHLMVKNI